MIETLFELLKYRIEDIETLMEIYQRNTPWKEIDDKKFNEALKRAKITIELDGETRTIPSWWNMVVSNWI